MGVIYGYARILYVEFLNIRGPFWYSWVENATSGGWNSHDLTIGGIQGPGDLANSL